MLFPLDDIAEFALDTLPPLTVTAHAEVFKIAFELVDVTEPPLTVNDVPPEILTPKFEPPLTDPPLIVIVPPDCSIALNDPEIIPVELSTVPALVAIA